MDRKIIGIVILLLVIVFSYFLFFSSVKKDERTIEQIVEDTYQQYDTVDFNRYYNLKISIRERGVIRDAVILSTVLYTEEQLPKDVAPSSLECIIFNYSGILTIKDNEFANEELKVCMSGDEVKALVKHFYKLDLDYLMVDYKNDVYLSPRPFSFERFFMLRVNDSTIVNENKHLCIEGKGIYTHYKGNWYLSDFYIKKYDIKID